MTEYVDQTYGFWNMGKGKHASRAKYFDFGLSNALNAFFKPLAIGPSFRIGDFGCGSGGYAKTLAGAGYDVIGYDGNPKTAEITDGLCFSANLAVRQELQVCSWVICLEVAEHIPEICQEVFLDNLHRHNTDGVIISWARRGQRGRGHVNCRDNGEVYEIFTGIGYVFDRKATRELRNKADVDWFQRNLLVFGKAL